MKKTDDTDLCIGRMANSLRQGATLDRNGERFLNYALDRISELDNRSKRHVMCSLLYFALQGDPRYGRYYEVLRKEYEESTGHMVIAPTSGLV